MRMPVWLARLARLAWWRRPEPGHGNGRKAGERLDQLRRQREEIDQLTSELSEVGGDEFRRQFEQALRGQV